jgi:hypothetical protein
MTIDVLFPSSIEGVLVQQFHCHAKCHEDMVL